MTEKKKQRGALFILGALYPEVTGGAEIFNYYFLRSIWKIIPEKIYYLGQSQFEHLDVVRTPFKLIRPVRIFYPIQLFIKLCKVRKQIDYAYVCYGEQSWVIAFSHAILFKLFRLPYYVTVHWGMSPDWKPEFPFRFFFTNASAISGVSTTICANYHEKLKGKEIIYIPPLIPFEKSPLSRHEALEKLGYDAKSRVILYVGSLKPMKNPDRILEAFSRLGIDYIKANNIRLLFAGGGPMAADLKKNAQTIGLAEYIRLDGVIGRDAIPTYYQAATCYIISSDYEGTSISLLEAMFNRLPIIGSDAPGINSMIEHGRSGLLYKTEDAANLADQIRNILDNGSRATQLGVEAFNSYQTSYSYENMLRQYKKMFSTAFESGISN